MKMLIRTGRLQVAAALFIAVVASLKPAQGQALSEKANGVEKRPAVSSLPDVRTLLDRQQQLRDARKYELCRKELREITNLSDLPARAAEPKWIELESQARKLGIATAFLDAKEVFIKNSSLLKKLDSFGIAIYSKTNWSRRKIFLADIEQTKIYSFDMQHARGNFQNAGHNRSSLGCFVGGLNTKDTAFSLHGFDGGLNSCACERRLQIHISQSWGASRPPSFGCLTLRRGTDRSYRAIAAALSGGGLICAYDEGRVPDRR
jgi:hypothetical protein